MYRAFAEGGIAEGVPKTYGRKGNADSKSASSEGGANAGPPAGEPDMMGSSALPANSVHTCSQIAKEL